MDGCESYKGEGKEGFENYTRRGYGGMREVEGESRSKGSECGCKV
jgi:hypothetical protein